MACADNPRSFLPGTDAVPPPEAHTPDF
jgi:hypothetical protein